MPGQHAEKRRFSRTVGADHADDPAGWQRETQIFDQEPVAIALFQIVDLDHLGPKARTIGNDDLGAGNLFALGLVGHFLIGVDTRLLLGLTRLGTGTDPFQFALKRFLARLVFAGFLRKALGLLLEPSRIIPLVGDAAPAIEFEDPARDIVEEIAVVGHDEDRALVFDQVLLQPSDGFGVKVVGRFVQEKHLGRFQKQFAQRHAPALAA